jgi:hypothetical protein
MKKRKVELCECGNKPILRKRKINYSGIDYLFFYLCTKCGVMSLSETSKNEAIDAWNRRVSFSKS